MIQRMHSRERVMQSSSSFAIIFTGEEATVSVVISRERPESPDARSLVEELEAHLATLYPAESRHGLSVERLVNEQVHLFVTRCDGEATGCGGVQLFASNCAELKRMCVRPPFRGRGFGRLMLDRLVEHSRQHGLRRVRLETGIHQLAAIQLYERNGFAKIPPFGPYTDDPLSRCYEKVVT
jgi:putative acetyltransferase